MRDYTLKKYEQLIGELQKAGYRFLTYEQYCLSPKDDLPERFVILRHDVDKRPLCSLRTAQVEQRLGIQATYYFRVVRESNRPEVIRQIAAIRHEIGYHYEDMSLARGDAAEAKRHFDKSLTYFRQFYPVRTCCMHGAPQSKWDSKLLWQTADYHDFGIIGEPYYDTDFCDVFYLTDTGRRWDGYKVSVRDKIPEHQDRWTKHGWVYHTTDDILEAISNGSLPSHIMITTHPQRWLDNMGSWLYELIRQTMVNMVKRFLILKK